MKATGQVYYKALYLLLKEPYSGHFSTPCAVQPARVRLEIMCRCILLSCCGSYLYEENFGVTRFVLYSLAEQAMPQEIWVDLWKIEGKLLVWTVGHIFPQGDTIPDSWVNMMAGGDKVRASGDYRNMGH